MFKNPFEYNFLYSDFLNIKNFNKTYRVKSSDFET